jgi:acetoin utilization protein AcuB
MTKPMPAIRAHMTPSPHSIGRDQPLSRAHEMMREHRIRHLPVLDAGALVGVLSDRDLHLIETLRDVDPARVDVEEAMSPVAYAVPPDTPLDEVLDQMAAHKYGCAVVMQSQHVVGIFTTSDVCRSFAALLRAS